MKKEAFQVVAELYRVLATFDPNAIDEASKLPSISENLRTAIIALHRETTSKDVAVVQTSVANRAPKEKNGGKSPLELLMDKKKFHTKQDMYVLADLLELEVPENPKESHERVARRLAGLIERDAKSLEHFYELVGLEPNRQTAGWIEVIRRNS